MNANQKIEIGTQLFAVFLAVALSAAPGLGQAQSPAAKGKLAAAKALAKSQPAPAAKSAKGMADGTQEGIKVHGDWTITIRNEDGSVASRHKFQNALTSSGGAGIAQILGRAKTAHWWEINLISNNPPCDNGAGARVACFITEPGAQVVIPAFLNLVVSLPNTGPDSGKLVLEGSAKATFAGDISEVETHLLCRLPTGVQAICDPNGSTTMTRYLRASAIQVQAKQTIDVTVVLSFS
jgi:hypothetical protein